VKGEGWRLSGASWVRVPQATKRTWPCAYRTDMFVKGGGSLEQVGSRSQRAYRPQGSTRKSYRDVFIEPIVVPWALCIKWGARDPPSMNNQHLAKKTKNSKTTKKPKKNDLPQNPQWETTIHAYGPQVNIYRIKRPNDQLGTNRVGHIYIYKPSMEMLEYRYI
jgi:hypothetical protein